MIGEQIGDWQIDAELVGDHKGRSFRGHSLADPKVSVVLKILGQADRVPDFFDLFQGRVTTIRKLAHPNIVAYVGGDVSKERPFVVSENVGGTDFQTLLKQGKRPVWQEVLGFALQIVAALRHAHRRGVLHGDLKPANVILTAEGQVKLAECGLARLFETSVPFVSDNPLCSAAFISPEQAAGKVATKRGDFYSVGCLLYAMLIGRPPFVASNAVELIHKHCFVMPERPAHFVRDLPEEFDALVMKLLSKDPQNRPGSGTLLIAELERIWANCEARGKIANRPSLPPDDQALDDDELVPAKISRRPESPPRPLLSRPLVVIPLFLAVVGIIIGAYYATRTDPDKLYAAALPLMESDNSADWDTAWNEYLDPLSRDFPEYRAQEIKSFRSRTKPLSDLRRYLLEGKKAKHAIESERLYYKGLELCRAGDLSGAKRHWERTVTAYANVPNEAPWVEACRQSANAIPPVEGFLTRQSSATALRGALDRAKKLREQGNGPEADAVLDALEAIYHDEADATAIRDMIRKERQN